MFTAELHLHPQSLYDSDMDPNQLADKIIEMGGKGCAITDHGCVSAIEDFRTVFAEKNLKLVPGCELYVDGGILGRQHCIVLAKDDEGWRGICRMVTRANEVQMETNGKFPVISESDLFAIARGYQGHIFCLSACMQGVINTVFRSNEIVERNIEKAKAQQEKYISSDDERYKAAVKREADTLAEKDDLTVKRDAARRLANKAFVAAGNKIARMEDGPEKDAMQAQLQANMQASEKAKNELPDLMLAVKDAVKAYNAAVKQRKILDESAEKFNTIQKEIDEFTKGLHSEKEQFETAEEKAKEYVDAFGTGFFYIEMQNHGIPAEKECFPKSLQVAHKLNIPIVATNDVHILTGTKEDILKRRTLRSLRFGIWENNNIGDNELYLKNQEELKEALVKIIPETDADTALANIDVIFDQCNVTFSHGQHYPKFHSENVNKELLNLIREGYHNRFPNGFPKGHEKEYQDRVNHEYQIICKMGYADYHLIVRDYITYGRLLGYFPKELIADAPLTIEGLEEEIKKNGWKNPGYYIGTGRGSAVGSLVCYLIGITNLDPIKYDLLFERFLNPERVSMPDIDVDFGQAIREKCVSYVKNKYGQKAVCGIMTKTMEQAKKAIDTAARFYGMQDNIKTLPIAADLKSMIRDPKETFSTPVDDKGAIACEGGVPLYTYMQKQVAGDKTKSDILKWAKIMEGSFVGYGAHAAGIVISDNTDVSEYLPLRYNNSPKVHGMTTQCDMVQVEDNGLLKFDFLGLKTCDIITEASKMIERDYGRVINMLTDVDINDAAVYQNIFQTGRTEAVFQFGSPGMKQMLVRFKPETFEDLIILVSMFRPGPLQFLDDVIAVKNGEKPMTFLCPQLKPILGKTYGAITYQEQVMQIFQQLAGYTLGGADMVRRYMSKKKAEKLAKERKAFIYGDPDRKIKGCAANGIKPEIANELFDQMMAFASYAFNKSHAAAYAYNAYLTAWLKYHYSAEFFAAAMNWADNTDELASLMNEARSMGVSVLAPDVNWSDKEFSVADGKIRFGLGAVRSVKNRADGIIEERKNGRYLNLVDFLKRTDTGRSVVDNLIDAGAFDNLMPDDSYSRRAIHDYVDKLTDPITKWRNKNKKIQAAEVLLPICNTMDDEGTIAAQEAAGFTAPPFKTAVKPEKLAKLLESLRVDLEDCDRALMVVQPERMSEDKYDVLEKERELLGLYVSASPLDDILPAKKQEAVTPASVKDTVQKIAPEDDDRVNLRVLGYISDIEERQGARVRYWTFTLSDDNGSISCIMFKDAYEKYRELVRNSYPVVASVSVSAKDAAYAKAIVNDLSKPRKSKQDACVFCEKEVGKTDFSKYTEDGINKAFLLIQTPTGAKTAVCTKAVTEKFMNDPNLNISRLSYDLQ